MKARLRRMVISPYAFFKIMMTGTSWKSKKGIPETAKMRGATLDPDTQNLILFIEDASFEEIDVETQVAPLLETEFLKLS